MCFIQHASAGFIEQKNWAVAQAKHDYIISVEGGKCRWYHLMLDPPFKFFRSYVLKLGVLDGVCGLVLSAAGAFPNFMKYAKMRQFEKQARSAGHAAECVQVPYADDFELPPDGGLYRLSK